MSAKYIAFILFALVSTSSMAVAQEYSVNQKNKAFSVMKLEIKVGDTVNFQNSDPFFHNIYSLSDTKTFDLGSYPEGQHRSVTFKKPGKVKVECAIHPQMMMEIEVKK